MNITIPFRKVCIVLLFTIFLTRFHQLAITMLTNFTNHKCFHCYHYTCIQYTWYDRIDYLPKITESEMWHYMLYDKVEQFTSMDNFVCTEGLNELSTDRFYQSSYKRHFLYVLQDQIYFTCTVYSRYTGMGTQFCRIRSFACF